MQEKSGIVFVGVGDGGVSAMNSIINRDLRTLDFIAINTHENGLRQSMASTNLLIGGDVTRGLGAGGRMEMGESAAESSADEIKETLKGAKKVIIVSSLGGGTGTGASLVVARIAGEIGAECVAVVSLPFEYEGKQRREIAEKGAERLKDMVNKLVVVDNDDLLQFAPDLTIIENALGMSATILSAKAIAELV